MSALAKKLLWVFALAVIYVAVYVVLSVNGVYLATPSGEVRYNFGLAMTDAQVWQPRFVYFKVLRDIEGRKTVAANWLGYVFAPLILLDQKLFHPTVYLFQKPEN